MPYVQYFQRSRDAKIGKELAMILLEIFSFKAQEF